MEGKLLEEYYKECKEGQGHTELRMRVGGSKRKGSEWSNGVESNNIVRTEREAEGKGRARRGREREGKGREARTGRKENKS